MARALVDIHAHVLPEVDDGPADLAQAVTLARAMADGGVGLVAATSHVSERYPNDAGRLARARERLVTALAEDGVPLEVTTGAEIALPEALRFEDDRLAGLRLGAGPWILVEPPLSPAASDIVPALRSLVARGHHVLLAHPERSPALQRAEAELPELVMDGVRCAVTSSALTGRFGRAAQGFAHRMLADGLAHVLTSDAHDLAGRPPSLRADVRAAEVHVPGLLELEDHLCRAVPTAILAGDPLPAPPGFVEPPAAPQASRWRRVLGRARR